MIQKQQRAIPAQSQYAAIINDLLRWYAEDPDNWRVAWQKLEDKWNHDLCPWAQSDLLPLQPENISGCFNIQGHFNGAYILLALLYGQGDYLRSIKICTRCGQDTDSNVANCGGILGVMYGYDSLPETVKSELSPYMDRNYNFTTLSIQSANELSYELALENIVAHGGGVSNGEITIPLQDFEFSGPCEASFPDFSFVDIFTLQPQHSPELNWQGSWDYPTGTEIQLGRVVSYRGQIPLPQEADRNYLAA